MKYKFETYINPLTLEEIAKKLEKEAKHGWRVVAFTQYIGVGMNILFSKFELSDKDLEALSSLSGGKK